jgi:hypothetical protein
MIFLVQERFNVYVIYAFAEYTNIAQYIVKTPTALQRTLPYTRREAGGAGSRVRIGPQTAKKAAFAVAGRARPQGRPGKELHIPA